jgi:predicted transcriptional regulator
MTRPTHRPGQGPGKKQWTASEKLRAVVEAATRSEKDLGEFLRREGLHEAEVQRWRAAAEAGKHVLVEKPIEINLERANALIAACDKAGVKLGVIFQSRFLPMVLQMKAAIDAGK